MPLAGSVPEGGTRPRAVEEVLAVDAKARSHASSLAAGEEVQVDEVALLMHPDVAALQVTGLAPVAASCRKTGVAFTTSDRR